MGRDALTMVDPPSGWKYGFPKAYNKEKDGTLEEFYLHHGYPEKEIELALKYTRIWKENA